MGQYESKLLETEIKKGSAQLKNKVHRARYYIRKLQELGFISLQVIEEADVLGMKCPTKLLIKAQPSGYGGAGEHRLPEQNLLSRSQMQQYIMEYDDTVVRRLLDMGYVTKVSRAGSTREWLQLTAKGNQIGVHRGKPILFYFDKTVRALGLRIGQKG